MDPNTVYLIKETNDAARCVRMLLEGGVDPTAIRIHSWKPLIAVRVRVAVPDSLASLLAEMGYDTMDADGAAAAAVPPTLRESRPRRRPHAPDRTQPVEPGHA